MSTANIFDLYKIYKDYFDKNSYYIDKNGTKNKFTQEDEFSGIQKNPHPKGKIHLSRTNQPFNKIGAYGQNIWFPIKLQGFEIQAGQPTIHTLEIDICTVSTKLTTGIIRTPVSDRKGCVHEIVNYEDTKFTIRGFLIGKNRQVPEDEIIKLKYFLESLYPVEMHGGYVELFLDKSCRIRITNLDFPEVQGQTHWIRPFSFECESDYLDDLKF